MEDIGEYEYVSADGALQRKSTSPEEPETVCIAYKNRDNEKMVRTKACKYSENYLRAEHGLPIRRSY